MVGGQNSNFKSSHLKKLSFKKRSFMMKSRNHYTESKNLFFSSGQTQHHSPSYSSSSPNPNSQPGANFSSSLLFFSFCFSPKFHWDFVLISYQLSVVCWRLTYEALRNGNRCFFLLSIHELL